MSNARRRMPITAEVDVFNAKIGGDQKVGARGKFQDGAIVANASDHSAVSAAMGQSPDAVDQLSFCQGQSSSTIAKKTTCRVFLSLPGGPSRDSVGAGLTEGVGINLTERTG